MIKKLSRIIILTFLLLITALGYSFDMTLLSFLGTFYLGFVISAILYKEKEELAFWAFSKGMPIKSLLKEDDEDERTERESDGKAKQKA